MGGHGINGRRFSGNTVLVVGNEHGFQSFADAVIVYSKIFRVLEFGCKKTEIIIISTRKDIQYNIYVNRETLKQVDHYKYLETVLTSCGRCLGEIGTGIALADVASSKI